MLPSLLIAAAAMFATPGEARPALEAALRDLCRSETALLGETAGHGDARTIEAKTILVRRLVDECGFGAILFEAGSYDFVELERRRRRGEPVERNHVASAIGGVWNRYREMQPLIDFLHERVASGRLRLGGIDDQLGSAGAFYSIDAMPAEFSGLLPANESAECRATMRRLIYGQVDGGERRAVIDCLRAFRGAVSRQVPGADQRERFHMLDNMNRFAARIGLEQAAQGRARDRSMWLNLGWQRARLPRGMKVIVWGATVHLSRDARASTSFPRGGQLGSYLARDRGAFFLAFSAAGGRYRSGTEERGIPPAAPGSLEAAALRGTAADTVYIDRAALRRLGPRPGGVFAHEPVTADWSRVGDGIIVFREERAPDVLPR